MLGRVWLAVKETAGTIIGLPIGVALGLYYRWESRKERRK